MDIDIILEPDVTPQQVAKLANEQSTGFIRYTGATVAVKPDE